MTKITLRLLTIQTLVLMTQPAFAVGLAGEAMANRLNNINTTVTIQGKLICSMGSQNNGEPCALKIRENGTGRVIQLSNTGNVMRLYQNGQTQVSVKGEMADNQTLQVQSTQAL